jgi:CRISPR-associated exonuclease Cas4
LIENVSSEEHDDYVLLSAINQYNYCPLRCYWMFVEHEYADNDHTIEGTLGHTRVHAEGQTARGELLQLRSVYLYSRRYRICGKADLIEERNGAVYPVEYKKGRMDAWTNDALQLCAQALCLEEMLEDARGTPVRIAQAYLYYASTGRRKTVPLTDELRRLTVQTITAVRTLLHTRQRPEVGYNARCKGCSLHHICLPRETAMLRSRTALQ